MNGNTVGVIPDCSKSSRKEPMSMSFCNKRKAPMMSTIIEIPKMKAIRMLFRSAFRNRRNGNFVARKSSNGIARNSMTFATVLTPYVTPTLCSIHNNSKILTIGKIAPNHFCIQSPHDFLRQFQYKFDEIISMMFPLRIISKKRFTFPCHRVYIKTTSRHARDFRV